ncbi:Adenylate kinase isoenzyme 6-like protein [Thalictrum thalictroides]|uniref:Adenylate kinase isoenzyme 6-like protein n=1 Tax=Thalictrum thalictroides TaxID=46969 RepID=A0A7J6UQZ2_THATH|nr:Adenylate kinase isoenzyme 6-like protein [Thalictrum thalictroides]
MAQSSKKKPNILVTGTPGVGKTTTSSLLADATQLHHINIGELVKHKNLHDGWDDDFDCHIINEDLSGYLISYSWLLVSWCLVSELLGNPVLYDRLSKRGYQGAKLSNNIECEIFQVLLEEAKGSYPEDMVIPLQSDSVEDISRNVGMLTDWVRSWQPAS